MNSKDKLYKCLRDWTINFVKNKDILLKSIESINQESEEFDLVVKYKDKEQFFIIAPYIDEQIISKIKKDNFFTLVIFNSKQNLDIVVQNWKKLAEFSKLSIFFVNPFAEQKWIINPATHNRICDGASLKQGLKSMFSMVEPVERKDQ